MAVSIVEPIAAGIIASLLNNHILSIFDMFRPCASAPEPTAEGEEDCASSASSASTAGSIHHTRNSKEFFWWVFGAFS